MEAQALIYLTFVIALTQIYSASSQCSNPKGFLQCLKSNADGKCDQLKRDGERRREEGKRRMSQCFTSAGCRAPSNNDDGDDDEMPPQMRAVKECMEGAKERITVQIKSKIEQCIGEDLPDDMEGPCGMGQGDHGGMMGRMRKAGKAMCDSYTSCNNKDAVKQCVQRELESHKDSMKREFEDKCVNRGMRVYNNLCGEGGAVNQCERSNSGCKEYFKDKKSQFCQCRSEIRAEARAIVKAEMEKCFNQASASAGGGFGAIIGNFANKIKSCIENNIGDDFGEEAESVCRDRSCPSSESAAEQNIRSKCQEIQASMETKGEAIKACIKSNMPAFIKLPGDGSGSFLDSCQAAQGFFGGASGGASGNGGGILGRLQGLFGGNKG